MSRERAVNTVIDVALALVFLAIAVALLSTLPLQTEDDHESFDADRTTNVLGTSTINVTYSIAPVLSNAADRESIDFDEETDESDAERVSHGPITSLVGDVAVAKLAVDSNRPITETGEQYEAAIDQRLQSSLVGSQFETRISAYWEPFEGASVSGRTAVGTEPPPNAAVSTAVMTVGSGMPDIQKEAIAAAENGHGYDRLARIVATAVVDGYLPPLEARHALEGTGVDRALIAYRYERFAEQFDGLTAEDIQSHLSHESVDPATANDHLIGALTERFHDELAQSFDSPAAAAAAVSTGTVTVTVRTWEP